MVVVVVVVAVGVGVVVVVAAGEKERGLDGCTSPDILAGKIALFIITTLFYWYREVKKVPQVRREGNQLKWRVDSVAELIDSYSTQCGPVWIIN